ncbi:MAG: GTPase Era [Treponema sp.]|jgi:GTP-binding protein Era|nr:GTPase Era [Treponema sp.]
METIQTESKKSAFAAVLGRPSVGKSTLVNRFCGEKVAIVSPVPQTTRNTIRGIVNREAGQIVFVDTPGRHKSEKKFNRKLLSLSDRSMEDADLILYVLDATRPPAGEEEAIAEKLAPLADRLTVAVNKIDAPGADLAAPGAFLREKIPGLKEDRIFQVSALKNQGLTELLDCLFRLAPQGEPFYPEDFYTDQDVSFRIAEIIREKAIARLREELPHSIYVDVADMEFRDAGDTPALGDTVPVESRDTASPRRRLWVRAFIAVERESQKGMVVGKGGQMIKTIRQAAQKDLDRIFDWKIDLDLRVKTAKDWRHNDALLKRLMDR